VERVKAMPRNAAAADGDSYRPDLLHEDEPRYLRRQKPVEIRRKKFAGRSASFYRRAFVFGIAATALITAAALAGDFLYHSPQVALLKPDQVELTGNHFVSRDAVLQQFARDRGHSVLSIPLDARRSALEELSWVETASVQRILPNRNLLLSMLMVSYSIGPAAKTISSPSSPASPTTRLGTSAAGACRRTRISSKILIWCARVLLIASAKLTSRMQRICER
jgi:hypothetical protein